MKELENQIAAHKKQISHVLDEVKLNNVLQKLKKEGKKKIRIVSLGCGDLAYPEALAIFDACNKLNLQCEYIGLDADQKSLNLIRDVNSGLNYAQTAKREKGHEMKISLCDASSATEVNKIAQIDFNSADLVIVRHPDILNNYPVFKKILNEVTPAIVKENGHVLLTTYQEEEYRKALEAVTPYTTENKVEGNKLTQYPVQSGKNIVGHTTTFYANQFNCLLQVDPQKRTQHLENKRIEKEKAEKEANSSRSWCGFFFKAAVVGVTAAVVATNIANTFSRPQ